MWACSILTSPRNSNLHKQCFQTPSWRGKRTVKFNKTTRYLVIKSKLSDDAPWNEPGYFALFDTCGELSSDWVVDTEGNRWSPALATMSKQRKWRRLRTTLSRPVGRPTMRRQRYNRQLYIMFTQKLYLLVMGCVSPRMASCMVLRTWISMELSLVQLSRQSIAAAKFKIQQARDRWFKPQMVFILTRQLGPGWDQSICVWIFVMLTFMHHDDPPFQFPTQSWAENEV
jgi:hypothetical protein